MTCDCIKTINELLATRNTRLALPLMMGGPQRLLIETEQITRGRGNRKCDMFSTFCPFCGEKQ